MQIRPNKEPVMSLIHNISIVAKYEARTLRRSWFFRLFTAGALFIFTMMNIGVFSPVGEEDWDLVAIPSSVPLINLYLINIGQALLVIFLASDFMKRDKKLDTNEVLYTRSMSNMEYILGKTWGILRLFLGLDLLILTVAMVINIISTKMTVDFMSYLSYLLIIPLPTLVFSLGFSFFLMSVLRNQALTFLLLLGFAALDMFYLWNRLGSIFDYMAFGLPVFKSGIVGFDNLEQILSQRSMYFALGAALIFGTVLLFKRLPQSKTHTALSVFSMLILAGYSGFYALKTYSQYSSNINMKQLVIETNREYEDRLFPDVESEELVIEHQGETIKGDAEIIIRNNNTEPLETYIFSLNPGLEVISAETKMGNTSFERFNHIIEITPASLLAPGNADTIMISYKGGINESFCFPDFIENTGENFYRIAMVNVNQRQAFLQDDYALLIPESHWYPVASLNYYPSNPARIKVDFSRFSLRVKNHEGLSAVSQGDKRKDGEFTFFEPVKPLTGLTLAIGNYLTDSILVDSIRYYCHYYPGHDYYKKDLAEIRDTLGPMISGIMRELETNFSTPYPFPTLTLLEVPVQFHSYPLKSTQTRAELQPSMVLLPEKLSTINNSGFAKRFTQQKKQMERNNQVVTDKELQVRILNNFIRNTFISGTDFRYVNGVAFNEPVRYRLGASFYFFRNNFQSSEYPVINSVFESHLQQVVEPEQDRFDNNELTENDKANLILRNIPFDELLRKNPGADTIRTAVTVKGDWLFNLLRAKAGPDRFNGWFKTYLDENKFRKVDLMKLNNDISKEFGFEFYPYLDSWFRGKEQPGFVVSNFRINEVVVNNRTRYHVTFRISNPEPAAGLFNVAFRTGESPQTNISFGNRGGINIMRQGRGMETDDISKIVFLGPMEAKRIGLLMDYQPRSMIINTLFSKNIPGQMAIPVSEVIKTRNSANLFEGEELLAELPDRQDPAEIIVDNEDPGFDTGMKTDNSPLKKLFGISRNQQEMYESIRYYWVPETWKPVVKSDYFGKYVLSAVYTRPSNTPERIVAWSTPIKEKGYYEIYTYIGKSADQVTVRRGGSEGVPPPPGQGNEESPFRDMHYRIHHDEGVEEITIDYENAEGGWNMLGRFYLSGDSAKVELTNQSQGKVVIADAIKWEKMD